MKNRLLWRFFVCAAGGIRTHTGLTPTDFKSVAYPNSATAARIQK